MQYILEEHTPEYWNGKDDSQAFFKPGTSTDEIQVIAGDVLKQNRDEIITQPSAYARRLSGVSVGVEYRLSNYLGRVTQLYPLK